MKLKQLKQAIKDIEDLYLDSLKDEEIEVSIISYKDDKNYIINNISMCKEEHGDIFLGIYIKIENEK